MIGGIILLQWIYGPDWIHSIICSLTTYIICLLSPARYQSSIVFIWVMGYMTMSHIYRMYVSYMSGIFDFTGTQMVITMKLTSFACNLHDGVADFQQVYKGSSEQNVQDVNENAALVGSNYSTAHKISDHFSKQSKLYSERRKYAITKLPSILEFLGYVRCHC